MTRSTCWFALAALLCATLGTFTSAAENAPSRQWPRWRGPLDQGSTTVGGYPTEWNSTKNVVWSVALPGIGCSTPAVWDDHILLTCPREGQDAVIDFDRQGQLRWQTDVGTGRSGKHRNGSGSNPSPVTDGRHIFAYFRSGHLAGLDFDGKLLWKTNLQERFAPDTLYWDVGTSPVLTDNAVVVAVMHSGESYLAAFAKASGKLLWKVARNYQTSVEGDHSYATPTVVERDGRQSIVVWGAEHLTAHAADNGRVLWTCGGFNPERKGNWVAVASAIVAGEMAIVPYGRGSHLTGVRLGGTDDVTETHRVWTRDDTGVFVPTPVAYDGKLYLVRDEGEVECLDPETGKSLWKENFPKHRAKFYASPLIAGGKLYAPREDGIILVADIAGKFALLAENDMGERVIASPVPTGGRLLIRGEKTLYCIGEK